MGNSSSSHGGSKSSRKCRSLPNSPDVRRQIPNAYGKGNGGTAIPLPATVLVQRRCPPDKVRPLPPTPNHTPTIPGLAKTGVDINGSSRPPSPPTSNHTIQTIKGAGNNNGLRQPQCKIPTSPHGPPPNLPNGSIPQHITANGPAATTGTTTTTATKHSMLDKLKLFNKDKTPSSNSSSNKSQVSKRTSSSSGFSSARSERSDSSLSLNDGHLSQIKPPAVSVTANRNKDKSKQSKLVSGSQKSSISSSSKLKLDKKEKSPARTANDADSKLGHSSIGRGQKSLTRGDQKVSSKSSSKTSLNSKLNESRSESKTSLIMPPNKTLLPSPGISTSIPKPVAAIKGTSKTIPPPPVQADNKKPAPLPSTANGSDKGLKREKSDISSNRTPSISDNSPQKTHIVKPIALLPDQMMPGSPLGRNLTYHQQQQVQQQLQNNNNISVNGIQQLCGGSPHQQLQDPNNMTYRTGSETFMMTSPSALNGRIMTSPKNNSALVSRKMDFRSPEHSSSHHHSSKFNTVPSKIVGTIYEEEKPVSVMPMRPLLRGYNTHHVTLPTRGARGHHFVADFCESDIGQGYCSDGDALRTRVGGPPSRFADIDNGYLSEGGGGIHGGKHFLTMMRTRTQLPTTIEERIRNSRGSLDSIGTTAPSSNSSNGSKMDSNGSPNRSSSRNGRDNWSKMPDPPVNGHNNVNIPQQHHHHQQQQQLSSQPPSPTSGRKDKSSPRRSTSASKQHQQHQQQQQHHGQSSSSSSSGSGRTKGVPPSFGYVKRSNGSATSTAEQQNIMMMGGGGGSGQNSCGQQQQQQQQQQGRTAHVSAVPRSGKIKVSGGTQTCNNDMQTKISPNAQHRSFSLTGPGATQLSQSIRERLATGSHSLPKPGTDMHVFQHRISNRTSGKMIDGSLSDTQTYAEVKPEYSTYAMWLKHSNTAGSRLSEGDSLESLQIGSPNMNRHNHKIIHRGGNESPYIQSPRLNRSNSIRSTKSEKMYPSMLSRGPDVEIEPYYCLPVGTVPPGANNGHVTGGVVGVPGVGGNVNQVVGVGPAAWSQPTSPTPINRTFGGPLSPTHGGPANLPGCHRLTYPKKNDDVHGSAASLLSGGSSLYGSAEERQANEIRRLKRELTDARDQVMSLSSQLSTNAHVVAAFEQSLSNMTQRLHQLTATAERKDGELTDMRQTIELLRKQSIQAGLTTAHMQSMGVQTATNQMCPNGGGGGGGGSGEALFSKPQSAMTNLHPRPQSATNGSNNSGIPGSMQRHHSSDSMCSLNSISSGCSAHDKKNKKKGWLRSSFTKAFSRNAKISKTNRHIGHGNADQQSTGSNQSHHHHHHHGHHQQHSSNNGPVSHDPALSKPPSSPTKNSPQKTVTLIENAKPIDAIDHEDHQVVEELKKQLREKDLVLTDIRLEALSSASQLENLKDTVMKMRAEMISLKQNNERLQKLVTSRSLAGSEASLGNAISPSGSIGESRRYSLADGNSRPPMELPKRLEEEVEEENIPPAPAPEPPPPPLSPTTHIDLTPPPPAIEPIPSPAHLPTGVEDVPDITDGKKLAISCYLGQPESFPKYYEEILETDDFYRKGENGECSENGFDERKSFPSATLNEFVIAYTYISGKTTWQNLDYIVRKTFKDYVSRIDPGTNLGLNTDSITSYHLGEAKRGPEMGFPELLPCGYIVGNVRSLYICLQGVGSLAFDSLIPRSIVHRYISLLTEHRRLILCGPSGTGKSYLARRLAEFLVARSARGNPSEAIATFNVDHKSSKELRQYLGHIAEQASIANGAADLPSVIILDNLHHASALGDVFSCLLSAGPAAKLPCIIGTMSQATCNTTNLQLHHNFRWVLTANHMEPVKGFLGRFLRRRLFQLELQTLNHQPELASVLAWLPTVWQHINRFLEIHSSSDVTIGPRLFLSCPLDLKDSQVWFTDIWNYHLSPYLVEAVREGVQLYGRRGGAWNDPSAFIRNSYPWPYGPDSVPPLRQINAEDVGLEGMPVSNGDAQDPLLNMLMRLQEAANYSENQEQESDCASLDSNITPDSSAGAE
ncbi:protein sickie isoform X8 [Episyrphus balteatus]|uniref:protein sickie isoform X8 n=1 Tax=Episyrphus balteatus TaxID=286459 RepID=UPI0024858313|nr:protein sickie isoform X8 [Episyrphus balteatus]